MSSKNFTDVIEEQELIDKLIKGGFGPLVEALLLNDAKCYTKKARLNKSGACRVLEWKPKELEQALARARELLAPELGDDD